MMFRLVAGLLIFTGLVFAQAQSVTLSATAPPAVNSVSGGVIGQRGGTTYFYWVVARYPAGDAQAFGPFSVFSAPATLSVSDYIRLTWQATEGASSYAVLRSATGLSPLSNNTCAACLVGTTTGTFIEDQGAALTSFTRNPALSSVSTELTLNNRDYAAPKVRLGEYFPWQPIGVGLLADRPATCTGLRDAYVCTGADCPSTLALYYCTSTNTWGLIAAGGGGTPANPDRSVQWNDAGSFGGDARFIFDALGVVNNEEGFSAGDGIVPGQISLLAGAAPSAPVAGKWKFFVDSGNDDYFRMIPNAGDNYYLQRSVNAPLDCTAFANGGLVTTDADGNQECVDRPAVTTDAFVVYQNATAATTSAATFDFVNYVVPANTLAVGDVCYIEMALTKTGTASTWQEVVFLNGTTSAEALTPFNAAVAAQTILGARTAFVVRSTTALVLLTEQWINSFQQVQNIGRVVTIDTTAAMNFRVRNVTSTGADVVQFEFVSFVCFR